MSSHFLNLRLPQYSYFYHIGVVFYLIMSNEHLVLRLYHEKIPYRKRASFLLEFQNGRSRILPLLGIVFCQSLDRDKPVTSSQSLVEKKHLIFQ